MSNAMDVKQVSVQLANTATDFQADQVKMHVMKAPEAADGGGIFILRAWAINHGADQGAGTAFILNLYNYGTSGTAVAGTIGTVGGTADPLGNGIPEAFTLTEAQRIVDAGEWLVVEKDETNSSDPTRCTVIIEYLLGN